MNDSGNGSFSFPLLFKKLKVLEALCGFVAKSSLYAHSSSVRRFGAQLDFSPTPQPP
ncbi:MAG: hypothetical protein P8Y63_04070 [Deltaproteobacteria bacterium]|jgi:hypothetical protein